MNRTAFCVLGLVLGAFRPAPALAGETAPGLPNPFYAMDTSFQRPGLTPPQQLDLVKELGYAGVAWTEPSAKVPSDQAIEQVKAAVGEIEKHGLKMFTIYCAARVTRQGEMADLPRMPAIMESLKGHGVILWLHFGGKGPAFDSLSAETPAVQKLRALAEMAKANGLRIAVYPHAGEWTEHFADAVKLAHVVNHPNFGVTFNLCHCLAAGDRAQIPVAAKTIEGCAVHGNPFRRRCGRDRAAMGPPDPTARSGHVRHADRIANTQTDRLHRTDRFSRLRHRQGRPLDPRADDAGLAAAFGVCRGLTARR